MKLCGAACSRKKSIYRRIAFLSLGVVFLLSGCSGAFEETWELWMMRNMKSILN